jgi:hypothetical protein
MDSIKQISHLALSIMLSCVLTVVSAGGERCESGCAPGQFMYWPSAFVMSCEACPEGHSCLGGNRVAVPCPTGNYAPAGSSAPTPCPADRFSNETGGQTVNACYKCPVGMYQPDTGSQHDIGVQRREPRVYPQADWIIIGSLLAGLIVFIVVSVGGLWFLSGAIDEWFVAPNVRQIKGRG